MTMDTSQSHEAPPATTEAHDANGQQPGAPTEPLACDGHEPGVSPITDAPAPAAPDAPLEPRPRPARRLIVVGLVLVVGVLGAVLAWREWGTRGPAERPRVAEAPPASAPTPTTEGPGVSLEASQLAQLTVAPVGLRGFHQETRATGKIAFNEDAMTPIFSPFPGRVTRLLAKPGDVITPGTPLVELYAPDLVQAEASLIGAVTALAKAKTALTLAQRIEARQHELYQEQAAALKDWEQAQ